MKQVTKKEFWDYIGPQDVVLNVLDHEYPYDTEFKTRSGTIKGINKTEYDPNNRSKYINTYFITK